MATRSGSASRHPLVSVRRGDRGIFGARAAAAESVGDRTISTLVCTELPHFTRMSTFMGLPYVEDVREVGNYDVAILGAPLDIGTTSVRVLASDRRASGRPQHTTAPATMRWA